MPTSRGSVRKVRKRVCFARDEDGRVLATSAEPPICFVEDLDEMWWDDEEFCGIRMDAQQIAASVADKMKSVLWSRPQNKAYRKAITRVHRACQKNRKRLDWKVQEDLEFWFCVGHSVRGLEKYILQELMSARDHRKHQITKAILYIQERGQREDMDQNEIDELIRVTSEVVSEPARRFAKFLAAADEVAALMEHQNSKEMALTSFRESLELITEQLNRKAALNTKRTTNTKKSPRKKKKKTISPPISPKRESRLRTSNRILSLLQENETEAIPPAEAPKVAIRKSPKRSRPKNDSSSGALPPVSRVVLNPAAA